MIYSLYVKEHNVTGLKYLGQTQKNPDTYLGSGKYWCKHLKVHGNNISTYILGTFDNKEELRQIGRQYSKTWNIVESNAWANLMEETGDGGGEFSTESINKIKEARAKQKPFSESSRKKMSESHKGKTSWNKGLKGCQTPWNKGLKGCQTSWNKGLTKETSNTIKIMTKKYSLYAKERKLNGYISPLLGKERKDITSRNKLFSICPYCNFGGKGPGMKRWHFEKCRDK